MTDTARPRAASIRARLRFDCFLFFLQVTLVDVRSGEEIERVILPLDSFHVGHYHIQRTGKVNCSREVNINCGNRWALFDTYAHLPLLLTHSLNQSINHSLTLRAFLSLRFTAHRNHALESTASSSLALPAKMAVATRRMHGLCSLSGSTSFL